MSNIQKRVEKLEGAAGPAVPVVDEELTARLRRAHVRLGLDWPPEAVAYTSTEARSLADMIAAAKRSICAKEGGL